MWQFPQGNNNSQGSFPDGGNLNPQLGFAGMNMQALGNYPPGFLNSLQNMQNNGMTDLQQATAVNQLLPSLGSGLAGAAAQQQSSAGLGGVAGLGGKADNVSGDNGLFGNAMAGSLNGNFSGGLNNGLSGGLNAGLAGGLSQSNKNLQLAMAAASNPQLLQYLQACQSNIFGGSGVNGVSNHLSGLGNSNMNPHQALMLAKQQQLQSQRSLLGTGTSQDQNQNSQQANSHSLNLGGLGGGKSFLNQGLAGFSAAQGQGSFSNRNSGQDLESALKAGMPSMSPSLLALIGGSSNSLNISGRSLLGPSALGTSDNDLAGTLEDDNDTAEPSYSASPQRETLKSGNSANRQPAFLPNPSAMDIPDQNVAAMLSESMDKAPGYVSGPSKSKVGSMSSILPPVLRGKYITKQPNCHDVLCGRGNFVNNHEGNKNFREIVALHKVMYVAAPKHSKPIFARKIIDTLHTLNPPGHFLAQEPTTKLWYELDNKKAMSKTRQALREGAPQIMKTIVDASTEVREGEEDGPAFGSSADKGKKESSDEEEEEENVYDV